MTGNFQVVAMFYPHLSKIMSAAVGAVAVCVCLSLAGAGQAARLQGKHLPPPSADEIVVFEADACVYCLLFRRNILPRYLRSPQTRDVSITFVDLQHNHERHRQLQKPLTVVPTVVLIRHGREVGRIAGYVDPDNFFALIRQMIRRSE